MLHDRWFLGRKAYSFALQWHLTNACELHCRHCYDRSKIRNLDLYFSKRIVQDFVRFCKRRRVKSHISLTGGNPFLYPGIMDLYRVIADAKISVSILGNPIPEQQVKELSSIQKPTYFQVSLEGLQEYNDYVRGDGHFARAIEFLSTGRRHNIRMHVMLTLHRANLEQVIPLAEKLRGLADRFTFNRLSEVGEGAALESPTKDEYIAFMKQYLMASKSNPILGFKDNLFNIFRHHYRRRLFHGCTGHGCGAAFNFFALLPHGEVHACRKFPSHIGNVIETDFNTIYESPQARLFRSGCQSCKMCPARNQCGGCLAVSYGQGLDIFNERDPYCFMGDRKHYLEPLAKYF